MTAALLGSPMPRRFTGLALALALMLLSALLIVLHISVGTVDLAPGDVLAVILGRPATVLHEQIVWDLRLPRALVALAAGAMLGTAGAILQLLTRNPLAEPGLMGVSGGAVLAIVLVIVTQGTLYERLDNATWLPLVGVAGGLAAGLLSYTLSLRGGSDPARLVLMGVLIAGVCSALTSVALMGVQGSDMMRVLRWTIGTTNGRVWLHLATILPYLIVGMGLALASAGLANALQLGDQTSRGLGLPVEPSRAWLLLVSSILTAGAVAVVGAIGLIGLIGPHIARRLVGQDARRLFPVSALVTGALLLLSDIIARILSLGWLLALMGLPGADSAGLPVGAVTALLGVPFFLFLLIRMQGPHR